MPLTVAKLFPDADRERIRRAVDAAESKTAGEIVPYVVQQCDDYEIAEWRGGALLGVFAGGIFLGIHRLTDVWLPIDVVGVITITIASFLIGMLAVKYIHPLKRLLVGRSLMAHRVAQRAAEAFVSEEVFRTRDRTGILLFLSMFEHQVLVLGDAGINARVKKTDWEDIVHIVVQGIREKRPTDGLVDAIGRCGELLQRQGVAVKSDDKDELGDSLRMSDR
jgi:putative membrane protein